MFGDLSLGVGVFLCRNDVDPFSQPPVHEAASGDGAVLLDGLTNGEPLRVALGVRGPGELAWRPSGGFRSCTPGVPVLVDPGGSASSPDGATPDTAFTNLLLAVLTALQQGGGNVWIAEGELAGVAVPVFDGVSIYGGFPADFDLEGRDPAARPTVLRGQDGGTVLGVAAPVAGSVIDGVTIEGAGSAAIGVDATDSLLELADVRVTGCTGRGIRLRANEGEPVRRVALFGVDSSANGGDGLSGAGPVDLELRRCTFAANAQEGAELDDLVAPAGVEVALLVHGSRFASNTTQGLDVDLAAPGVPGPVPGRFRIEVANCAFESNLDEGLVLDIDYENAPGWHARLDVRGVQARANGGNGVRVDLDGSSDTRLHRVAASANRGHGIVVSSESFPGIAAVTACASMGNAGAGVSIQNGQFVPLVSHCVVAGNGGGGVVSQLGLGTVASSVAIAETPAWSGVRVRGSLATSGAGVFESAPIAFARIVGFDGSLASLATSLSVPFGSFVEIDDDGVSRAPTLVGSGAALTFDPAPATIPVPAVLAVFPPGEAVAEDWRLAPGSAAAGIALADETGTPGDAGPFGATAAGTPGDDEATEQRLFLPTAFEPAPHAVLAGSTPIEIEFEDDLDPTSVGPGVVRARTANGSELSVLVTPIGSRLLVTPVAGGWSGQSFDLELATGLRSLDGRSLAAVLSVPYGP